MAARTRRREAVPARTAKGTSTRKKNPRQGFPKGSKHPSAQLTATVVRQLRAGKFDGRPYAELAEKWGVSAAAVSLARTGKTWTWLPGARKPMKPTDPRRAQVRRPPGTRAKARKAR